MTHNDFEKLIDELDNESLNTLKTKNAKYAPYEDALRNFHVGATIMGTSTAMCVWGYTTKHLSSLRDRIHYNNWNDLNDVKEKIQDTINYLRFLWCVANEENSMNNEIEKNDEIFNCEDCKYDWIGDIEEHWNEEGDKIIIEPCKSCKGNFVIGTEEYKNAKNNYRSK